MPFSDWVLKTEDIEICKRPDGDDWQIGCGAFGQVCTAALETKGVGAMLVRCGQFVGGRGGDYMTLRPGKISNEPSRYIVTERRAVKFLHRAVLVRCIQQCAAPGSVRRGAAAHVRATEGA